MPAPAKVLELIELFDRNLAAYKSGQYNEAQARQEFINPLFRALGWDMDNEKGYAEAYKDVVHEDSVRVEGAAKAPDYSFRIGGQRKFFVEAKKPSVDLKGDIHPAYQLRRYAWSAKLPLSILTDFEEFAVYDCRVKPDKGDQAATARVIYFGYRDYAARWDEIAALFSPDAILRGSFDAYAESKTAKRGTAEVDAAFLAEIQRWRELLAKNIALRNPSLSQRDLNYAVQLTIDRIIFLRICEARGIEPEGGLRDLGKGRDVYANLVYSFRQADARYNSGLFHFESEKGRTGSPDTLTPGLVIDDKALKDLLANLYYPDSPYEFSVIPADILGHVYEQFLGQVIRLTPGRRVSIEDKPEVRKAGGVYYTPTYVVDYIVRETVGGLVDGKSPQETRDIRVLDPACGSGSFLLGAYQYLLDWHLQWYATHQPEKLARGRQAPIAPDAVGSWRLTIDERKRILLDHIFGVDIDPQAVEVTKLSLLLKVLEGESSQTLNPQMSLLHERALPNLDANIKCGNSLIGPDFYAGSQLSLIDDDTMRRINTFDWEKEFPKVFRPDSSAESNQDYGFDAVLGNPPYIFTRNQGLDYLQKVYFYNNYHFQSNQLNTFGLFLEKSFQLLNPRGQVGFITPNNWLTISSFSHLRRFLLENSSFFKIINILDRVFKASVDNAIVLAKKGHLTEFIVAEIKNRAEVFSRNVQVNSVEPPEYVIQISLLKSEGAGNFLARIEEKSVPLRDLSIVSTGLKAYQTGKGKPSQTDYHKTNRVFHSATPKDETFGSYLQGADVRRYQLLWSGEYLSYGDWLAETRKSVPFSGERILVRQIPSSPPHLVNAVLTEKPFYNDINSMVVFAPKTAVKLAYILGCLNSRLLSFWFQRKYDKLQRQIFPQFKVGELGAFPIHPIDFTNPADAARHDQMVALVQRMLDLHRRLAAALTPHDKTLFQRQIEATDKEIDRLVYALYDLTAEEIAVVEAAGEKRP